MAIEISRFTGAPSFPTFTSVEKKEVEHTTYNPFHGCELPHPKKFNRDYELLLLCEGSAKIQQNGMQMQSDRLKELSEKRKAYHEMRVKKLEEAAAKISASNGWSMLVKAASIFAAICTIGIGIGAVMTGGASIAGIAMICSGAALLTNELASTLQLWQKLADTLAKGDKQKRDKILYHLELWTRVGTALLGLVSLAAGYNAVLTKGLKVAQMALQGGGSVISGVGIAGQTKNEYDKKIIEALLEELEAKSTEASLNHQEVTRLLTNSMGDQVGLYKLQQELLGKSREEQEILFRNWR